MVTMLTAPSLADPAPDRCTKGLAYAKAGDLPHAALYLDGCTGDEAERASAQVMTKLRASELSALSISSEPSGVTVETDAMPGEQLTTPAEIWVKAGTYKLRFTGDSVLGFEREVTLRVGRIENLTVTLTPAPPPKAVEKTVAPPAPSSGPVGSPQLGSLTNIANREKNTKEPRREVLLSCSGNTRNMLLVLTQDLPERIYQSAEATFYVLSGQGSARVGSLQSVIDTGSFVAVPRGTMFSLTRQGKAPLMMLL